jgi:shikimate dehydrogenase
MGKTIELGLIGHPVSHSKSPEIFDLFFQKFQYTGLYRLIDLKTLTTLNELLTDFPNLSGFNVTIPHKTAIVPLLDTIDVSASNIGAVNTVKITYSNGTPHFTGYNTDFYGFKSTLDFLPHEFNSAYILGTGGASKAVLSALSERETEIMFVSRNTKNNRTISYENFNNIKWTGNPLIVNTTPVGMSPNVFEMPSIDLQKIPTNSLIIDLIYNPETTKLMSEANRLNIFAINGMTMLKVQAEKAWEIFTK